MPSASNWIHLEECDVLAESDKAILVACELFEEDLWIPRSQISEGEKYHKDDTDVTISVTEWWVKKNKIEVD